MKDRLNFEARYPHPPARVWKALTDPEALAKWLFPNNFAPKLGHRFEMVTTDGQERIACEVVELEQGKRISFTWDGGEDEPPSVVSWTLEPDDDGGTHLTLEHQMLEPAASYVLLEAGMNWRHLMGSPLPLVLQALGRQPVPIVYVVEQDEAPNGRIAGLTRRHEETTEKASEEATCK